MALRIIVKPPATQDVEDAVAWYYKENVRVAEKFLFEFYDAVRALSSAPLRFQKRYKDIRACALKRFPYNIFYFVEKETLFVIAVLHQKRNPVLWKSRR